MHDDFNSGIDERQQAIEYTEIRWLNICSDDSVGSIDVWKSEEAEKEKGDGKERDHKNQLQIVPRFSFNESLDFALNPKIVSFFCFFTITNKETITKLGKNKSQETISQKQNII